MPDWLIQILSIYFAGAVLTIFICNITFRYHNFQKKNSIDLTEDDVGGIVLGTIFWPLVLPLGALFLVASFICKFINNTAIAIVKSMTGVAND